MRQTVQSLHGRNRGAGRELRNAIRRFAVAATSAVLWALEGFEDADGNVERQDAEVFSGVGFYARPPATARAEVVVAKVGGESGHPAIIATRDQDTLAAVQALGGSVGEGETIMFNSGAWVRLNADGTVYIGTPGGVVRQLVTKEDFENHGHATAGGTGTPSGPAVIPPYEAFTYTSKLRAG